MDTREKTKRRNPVETANPINRLFFWWTIKLFRKGATSDLDIKDLYDPVQSDESEYLGNKLEREWRKELEKLKNIEYGLDGEGKKIKSSQRPSLMRAIFRTFCLKYLYVGMFLLLMSIILRPMQPVLQGLVVRYFSGGDPAEIPTRDQTIYYAIGLVLTTLGVTFIVHHTNLDNQQIGMQIRVACCSLIYRKSLRLSKSSLDRTAAGQVVNLLSNDVNRFDTLPLFLNYVWIMPFQLIVVGYVMWQSVQVCALVGIAILLLLAIPIQGYLSKVSSRLRSRTAKLTDRRVQLMNELIAGIQVVKMYAWEKPFEKIVSKTRAHEIREISKSSHLRGLYCSIMVFTERTTLFLTIITYVLMGNPLTAKISSELSTHFNILQMTTAIFFPQALIMCGETLVSVKRIEQFLLLDEVTTDDDKPKEKDEKSQKHEARSANAKKAVTVEFQRVSANWISGVLPPTLCDVTLKIPSGNLCALIGPVGSGKTAILNVLLQELPLGAGSITLMQYENDFNKTQRKRGFVTDNPDFSISYASQDSWLFSGTVRENILFGQPYEKTRYMEVAKVCALLKDFRQLPDGDMTFVSERGSGLSGGQRARINLARAIYRRADLYLLDDPLSAVDARVARHLFKKCIVEYLKGKTRILVTHQLQFLKQVDTIVMMDRGAAKHQGSWEELTNSSVDFKEMLAKLKEQKTGSENREAEERNQEDQRIEAIENQSVTKEETEICRTPPSVNKWTRFRGSQEIDDDTKSHHSATVEDRKFGPPKASELPASTMEIMRRDSVRSQESYGYDDDYIGPANENSGEEESKTSGRMAGRIYKLYLRAGAGIFMSCLMIFNLLISQVVTSAADYWLSYWANIELVRANIRDAGVFVPTKEYKVVANNTLFTYFSLLDEDGLIPTKSAIYIYTFFIIACICLTLLRSYLFMRISMIASRSLHNQMFANILRATMRFFNLNSSGRILNRFSKDVGAMDELLPKAFLEAIQIFLVLAGILAMVALVNQWMIIPMIVIGIVFYITRIYYLNTAQDIKRLEGITKSPVFSHISSTLNGLTTIRSSGKDIQVTLQKEFDNYQDTHTGAWFLYIATASTFGLALDLVSCLFVTCVIFSFIFVDTGETFGGYVGLAISQSLVLTGMLQYGVKLTTDVQSQMTSVERIIEYTDLPKEGALTSDNPPPPSWPENGRIEMRNVFMRYKIEDPPVLKNLNLVIQPGWKIGVVGRTGAGKSSLISALFRLTGEGLEGDIIIDELNTGKIGLHELRSCISIIPQEPVLFSESLRYNLDPFGKYEDAKLWDALREVELGDAALDQKVTEGGSNFSVGQRQLICLARAILRNNRVLILDEATANIDSRTDALIQRTIRSKFANCTVVTIAHRLNTIIDSDRVLVMDGGRMVEYGTPYELLYKTPDGQFLQMVRQTGNVMSQNLMNFALGVHQRSSSTIESSSL